MEESIPDVLGRVADVVREVDDSSRSGRLSISEPVSLSVEREAGGVWVRIADGRIAGLHVDDTDDEPQEIADRIRALANEALAEFEAAHLEQLTKVNQSFGALVQQLSGLQADVQAAFERDVRRLS